MGAIQSIVQYYPSRWSLGGGVVCAIAAVEMGAWALGDLFKLVTGKSTAVTTTDLSTNLAGTAFYGLCAANIVPYTPMIGAVLCVFKALLQTDGANTYRFFQLIHDVGSLIENFVGTLCNWTIVPLWNHVLEPICNGILALLKRIPLPQNPAWIGVALLITAAVVYKGAPLLYNRVAPLL